LFYSIHITYFVLPFTSVSYSELILLYSFGNLLTATDLKMKQTFLVAFFPISIETSAYLSSHHLAVTTEKNDICNRNYFLLFSIRTLLWRQDILFLIRFFWFL